MQTIGTLVAFAAVVAALFIAVKDVLHWLSLRSARRRVDAQQGPTQAFHPLDIPAFLQRKPAS